MRKPGLSEPLGQLGRQRGRAVAALLVLGIALPGVGALLKPYVGAAVFLLLATSFLRADVAALKRAFSRPALVLAATTWTMLAIPALAAITAAPLAAQFGTPEFRTALMLHAIASPMMSAPAFAALMGLDATLALATLVLSSALLPVTATAFAAAAGLGLSLSPLTIGAQLGAVLAGSALIAFAIRRRVSVEAIKRYSDEIDGCNIIILFVFIAALMSDVARQLFAEPLMVAGLTAFAFAIYFCLVWLTALVFRRAGREQAFAVGVVTSQRNLGLMLAATGGALPGFVWLYIAVNQFPIYLGPLMLAPVVRRLQSGSGEEMAQPKHSENRASSGPMTTDAG